MHCDTECQDPYLVVNHIRFSRTYLRRILQRMDPVTVLEVDDGRSALQVLEHLEGRVKAIIADFNVPRITGLELLKAVRLGETAASWKAPFIMTSSTDSAVLAGLALSLDIDALLARPVSGAALERHLQRIHSKHRVDKFSVGLQDDYKEVPTLPVGDVSATNPNAFVGVTARAERLTNEPILDVRKEVEIPIGDVPVGSVLSRDVVNVLGATLMRAGDTLTPHLKEILDSYADLDNTISRLWINPQPVDRIKLPGRDEHSTY